MAVPAFRCQHSSSPSYLSDEIHRASDVDSRQRLRSASTALKSFFAHSTATTELYPLLRRKYGTPCRSTSHSASYTVTAVLQTETENLTFYELPCNRQCPIMMALWFCASLCCYVNLRLFCLTSRLMPFVVFTYSVWSRVTDQPPVSTQQVLTFELFDFGFSTNYLLNGTVATQLVQFCILQDCSMIGISFAGRCRWHS